MNLKKNVSFAVLVCVSAALLFAGGSKQTKAVQSDKPSVVHVASLSGSSGISMAPLFDKNLSLDGVPVTFEVVASPDVLLPKMLNGEIDIGILPPNVAAKVYTKNNGALVVGAVVGHGMLYLITKDPAVSSIYDLKGKTVAVAGHGVTPEYLFRYLLGKAGIPEGGKDGVQLDFSLPPAEIAPALISGKISYALVPEPFATVAEMKDPSVRRAIDLQEVWAAVPLNLENYPMTVVVIRKEFAEKYPETVKLFLDEYRKAVGEVNADPVGTGELVEKYTLGLNAAVAARVIPRASFVFIPASEARMEVEQLLKIFLEFAPESIGGALPGDSFYFTY